MKKIVYWSVSDNYSVDGRDPSGRKTIGNFFDKNDAMLYSHGRGNYGHDASVTEHELIIFDTYQEAINKEDEKRDKQKALDKLTNREKRLLGLL